MYPGLAHLDEMTFLYGIYNEYGTLKPFPIKGSEKGKKIGGVIIIK